MRWRLRRRASDVTGLRADLEQMRSRLDTLLEICAEAGVRVESAARDAVEGVAPGLIVASRTRVSGGEPVSLTSPDGWRAIAVLGGGGDPDRQLANVRELALEAGHPHDHVMRIGHSLMVTGLSAVAVPAADSVAVIVSRGLPAAEQRTAARTAMRAARRAGWLPTRVPGWLLLPLVFRRHGLAVVSGKVQAAIAGAGALTAAGVATSILIAVPAPPQGSVRIIPLRPAASRPATVHRHRRPVRVVAKAHHPGGTVAATGATPQSSPQPLPSVQASLPVPAASASVSASVPGQTCVWLLGLYVCLPV